MKVVIIGSGNVATVLANIINNSGHEIVQILSREQNNAKNLASLFNCSYGSFIRTPYADADIYIIAISDAALWNLSQYAHLGKKLVVHTAGSVSIQVLKEISDNYGILYPLQSLSKNSDHTPEIPLLIDGNSDFVKNELELFAKSLTPNVSFANDDERLRYHVAAVLVGNFTNHLYALAEEFCDQEHIDFKTLFPLIKETAFRIEDQSPKNVQTGPAIREDILTMGKHLKALTPHSDLKYLYLKLSESILKFHQNK
jgi:predicted short-subunit dehydrogenase-like oxidoreductase (DUF2520 family)